MTKKTATLIPYVDDIDEFEVDDHQDEKIETHAQKKAVDFIEAMSGKDETGEGKVKIMRMLSHGEGSEQIATYALDKFDSYEDLMEHIRSKWGGGEYKLQVKIINKEGKSVIAGSRMMKIAKELESETQASPFGEIANYMDKQQAAFIDLLEKRSPQKAMDFESMLEKFAMVTMAIAPIITVVMANRPKQQDPMKMMSQMLLMTGQIKDLNVVATEEEEDTGFMGIAKGFIQAFQQVQAQGKITALAAQPLADGAHTEDIQPVTQTSGVSTDPVYAPYAPFFDLLLAIVEAEKVPNTKSTAKSLIKELNAEQRILFEKLLAMPNYLSFVLGYNLAFAKHIDWINDFLIDFEICMNDEDLPKGDDLDNNGASDSNTETNDADITDTNTDEKGSTVE